MTEVFKEFRNVSINVILLHREKIDFAIIQEYLMCDRHPEEVKNTY